MHQTRSLALNTLKAGNSALAVAGFKGALCGEGKGRGKGCREKGKARKREGNTGNTGSTEYCN